jgi:hypothetical protein
VGINASNPALAVKVQIQSKNKNAVPNGLHIHAYQHMRCKERYDNNATCELVSYTMNNDHGLVTWASVNRQKIGSAYICNVWKKGTN